MFAEGGRSAAAPGFIVGLAGRAGLAGADRATAPRPLGWIRQDFTEIEPGALSVSGLVEPRGERRLRRPCRFSHEFSCNSEIIDKALIFQCLGLRVGEP